MKRLAIPVDDEMAEEIKFIPDGLRAEVFRRLISIVIETQKSNMNLYIVDDIINNRVILVKRDQVVEGTIPGGFKID